MDRMDLQLDRLQESERQLSTSNSNANLGRVRAMTHLINHCRVLSGWTPYGEVELASILPTWMDALQEVPDHLLKASVDKATADHDWSKPFPVKLIVDGYKRLLLEDREKRQTLGGRRRDDTTRCRYCDDTGYVPIATYCPTGNEWYYPVYGCQCAATPISQRQAVQVRDCWERDDRGRWVPGSAQESPRCRCGFCRMKGGA
jgi:hypothetical protein